MRVYFNSERATDEGEWSVDQGDISSEQTFHSIHLLGAWRGASNPDAIWPEPSAWLTEESPKPATLVVYGRIAVCSTL